MPLSRALLLLYLLLNLATGHASAQAPEGFVLLDSAHYTLSNSPFYQKQTPIAKILRSGNELYFLVAETGQLQRLDLSTSAVTQLLPKSDAKEALKIYNFEVSSDRVFVVTAQMSHIYEYDLQGQPLRTIKINPMFRKTWLSGFRNFTYSEARQAFYLDVGPNTPVERNMLRKPEAAKKHFERQNLIAEVDTRGRIRQTLGSFAPIYRQNLYFHSSDYNYFVTPEGKIVMTHNLSHAFSLIDPASGTTDTLAFPGQYIRSTNIPITTQPYLESEDYYSHVLATYDYPYLQPLNASRLCYRGYRDAGVDSTRFKTYPPREVPANNKACVAPSQRKLDQIELQRQKPYYIQIIDHQHNKLLYDGVFNFLGKYFLPAHQAPAAHFYTYFWDTDGVHIYTYGLR